MIVEHGEIEISMLRRVHEVIGAMVNILRILFGVLMEYSIQ
jgi:hypothetical protein